jgi:hypothetical protein
LFSTLLFLTDPTLTHSLLLLLVPGVMMMSWKPIDMETAVENNPGF